MPQWLKLYLKYGPKCSAGSAAPAKNQTLPEAVKLLIVVGLAARLEAAPFQRFFYPAPIVPAAVAGAAAV
jgi:hypothetical protein